MKTLLFTTLIPVLAVSAIAQDEPFMVRAALVPKDGGRNSVGFIINANNAQIEYRTIANSPTTTVSAIKDFETIYFLEPAEYAVALELYNAGKYDEAKLKFAKYKEQSKFVAKIPGNHHTLSAFYELECMRKMGDLKGLSEALQGFDKEGLTREHHIRQMDLYVLWDAVKAESWDRVLAVSTERETQKMPDYQIVQVLYCKGLALQKLNRPEEAIVAYNAAITADAKIPADLVSKSALNLLDIYIKDEEVKTAMADWKSEREKKGSPGYNRLLEAGALARFYDKFLSTSKALPVEYKKLLDFQVKEEK
jgi:tetratricopeptide (TPR) repeat protein